MSTISYKQPELTEEEQKSNYFPKGMLCDACQIVVFEVSHITDFEKSCSYNLKHQLDRIPPPSEFLLYP